MRRRFLRLAFVFLLAATPACVPLRPPSQEPVVLRSQSDAVPAYLREVVSGKTISLRIPSEMRSAAIDYLRAAGAIVVDGWQSELRLEGSSRSEPVYYPLGLTVNYSRVQGQRAIVELHLTGLRPDGARQILFQGRGEAIHDSENRARGMDIAGQRALLNLH